MQKRYRTNTVKVHFPLGTRRIRGSVGKSSRKVGLIHSNYNSVQSIILALQSAPFQPWLLMENRLNQSLNLDLFPMKIYALNEGTNFGFSAFDFDFCPQNGVFAFPRFNLVAQLQVQHILGSGRLLDHNIHLARLKSH